MPVTEYGEAGITTLSKRSKHYLSTRPKTDQVEPFAPMGAVAVEIGATALSAQLIATPDRARSGPVLTVT